MWPMKFQLIMLDILRPKMSFTIAHPFFQRVIEKEDGSLKIESIKVPDYLNAIEYYLNENPGERLSVEYMTKPASDKIKKAYGYLWNWFQHEITSNVTEQNLQYLLICFRDFQIDVEQYKVLKKWIMEERERIFKRPAHEDELRTFVKFMDDADHVIALLACLESSCQIIEDGLSLITIKLQSLENNKQGGSLTNKEIGFDTYIDEKYRAKLMPYLVANYSGLEPRFYAYMVGALIRLKITPESTRHGNKSAVHRALSQSFKATFPPQSWNTAINRLDVVNSDEDRREVNTRYELIKGLLEL